jgi:excisionase family DNA binding protein
MHLPSKFNWKAFFMLGPVREVSTTVGHQDGEAKADSSNRGVLHKNLHGAKTMRLTKEEKSVEEPATNSILLDLPRASSAAGLTVWQMRGLIASGEIPVVRVGRKLYVRRQTLQRWAERAEGRHRT